MNTTANTCTGVIEGFFGASWQWPERHQLVDFLQSHHYRFYIYAPKADPCLRRHWRQQWTATEAEALASLREHCRQADIAFGLGLSPLDLCQDLDGDGREAFSRKIAELNDLQPDILCLLFDDMRGDIPHLADVQAELTTRAQSLTNASRIILCPTYYSDDPVLERVFGERPRDYWQDLGRQLDPHTDIFWTGPRVCSEHVSVEHLQDVSQRLGRKPFLWDNYPVNDGAVKSRHLHLRPFAADRAHLAGLVSGHAVNPMNQFYLSLPALASLPLAYAEGAQYAPQAHYPELLRELCGSSLAQMLYEDTPLLQDLGLDGLTAAQKTTLLEKYRALPASGFQRELIDWLENKYLFDPACLTD